MSRELYPVYIILAALVLAGGVLVFSVATAKRDSRPVDTEVLSVSGGHPGERCLIQVNWKTHAIGATCFEEPR